MRQAGIIAAAGIYALEHNVERLAEDHANAAVIAHRLEECSGATVRSPSVPTNIVLIETRSSAPELAAALSRDGVLVSVMGSHAIRCVTHLGVSAADARRAAAVMADLLAA
jgi:threonine aldolase